jgi:transposase
MWKAPVVNLRPRQKEILTQIAKSRTARSDHRQRASLILLCDEGFSNNRAGKKVGLTNWQAGNWRKRWLENQDKLIAIETAENTKPNGLLKGIEVVLSDLPRSGAKPTFTAEQIAQILAVACEDPQDSELPLSHWTLEALKNEVINRAIVPTISTSRLQVFLKSGRVKAA